MRDYDGEDRYVLEFSQRIALRSAQRKPETWRDWLKLIARSYAKGVISDPYFGVKFTRAARSQILPQTIAEEIVEQCDAYPTELVGWAELTCRQHLSEQVVPVGSVALDQGWFETQQ